MAAALLAVAAPLLHLPRFGLPVLLALAAAIPLLWAAASAIAAGFDASAWREILADPQWPRALVHSMLTGLAATALSMLATALILSRTFAAGPWRFVVRTLAPMLAMPHAAFAIGLAFLLAPSGWILRAFSPWATGFELARDWPTTQDPWGLGLIVALVGKEIPFLLWVAASQLQRADAGARWARELELACTMGYTRSAAWWGGVAPAAAAARRAGARRGRLQPDRRGRGPGDRSHGQRAGLAPAIPLERGPSRHAQDRRTAQLRLARSAGFRVPAGDARTRSRQLLRRAVLWLEAGPASWDLHMRRIAYLPLLPSILWVVGLHKLALAWHVDGQWLGLWIGHTLAALPYVLIASSPSYLDLDLRYQHVAASLGRGRLAFVLHVKWPLLRAGLFAAVAVGFSVSVAQYLPTVFIGGGRFGTVTTEAVALASGGQRSVLAAYAWLQWLLPTAAFALAAWLGRPRRFRKRS